MDTDFYNELVKISKEVRVETTLQKLSLDKQLTLNEFFKDMVKTAPERPTEIEVRTIAGWAFCIGHEWALRHWALWLEEKDNQRSKGER